MSTDIKDLEKDLKNNSVKGIYVFWGEEKYLQQEYIKKIKKIFGDTLLGINYILLDEGNIKNLISDIEKPSFGYEKKLIIIKNSNLFKKDCKLPIKDLLKKYIQENIEMINKISIKILVEEKIHKMDFYKIVEKNGIVIEFKGLRENELKSRLKKICLLYKVEISDQNISHLIEISGTKMQNLINEIRKLIEYAGEGGKIQTEDIDRLATKDVQAIIFDLTDYLGIKDTKKALDVLDNLIYNKEPLQKIIITLYNHFKKIYFTKLAQTAEKDIAQTLSLKPNQLFLINKYKKQANYFNEKEIEEILKELIDLDYKSKLGMIDLEIGLKTILCKNC